MRSRLWRSVLSNTEQLETGDLERLAGAFHFTAGRISRAVRRAQAEVAELPPGHRRLTVSVLEKVCRSIGSAGMSSLAQKLALPYTMSDLIVPDHLRAELHLAVAWVRYQQKVLEGWNFGRRVPFGHGLTALFSGPPGTGKTMAAQVLAHELGLDLYRIDLSRVMSKYIGETEKNLARLFEEAYAAGAILFFDEADAIFGKRTEVRDAHDRYANVEIGYLLQRMEEHDGVTILATNRMRDMDEGFIRRFHFILNFSMPGEADRLRIWNGMFPAEAERDTNLDLRPLARNFEVTGGEIRNTVLAAAFLAASDGRPIEMTHLRRALRRELGKNGRVVDERALEAL
jgi:SpoVK/Ycf46/Vps4 family AAA+-type ATPase